MWRIKWFIIRLLLTKHERFLMWTALRDATVRKFNCMGETLVDDARYSDKMYSELVDHTYEDEY